MDALIRSIHLSPTRLRLSDARADDPMANTEFDALRAGMEADVRKELASQAKEIFDTERTRGYADGQAAAAKELEQVREALHEKALDEIAAMEREQAAAIQRLETAVGEVAFAAVCRLVGECATSQAFVLGLVEQVCAPLRAGTVASVRLRPKDIATLGEQLNGDELPLRSLVLQVTADASLEFGGCVVDTDSSQFDGSLDTQLRRLHAVLTGPVAS